MIHNFSFTISEQVKIIHWEGGDVVIRNTLYILKTTTTTTNVECITPIVSLIYDS